MCKQTEILSSPAISREGLLADWYRRYYSASVNMALSLEKDLHNAEDLVQEVFVSLLGKEQTLEKTASVSSFLFVCIRNRYMSNLRHKHRKRKLEMVEEKFGLHIGDPLMADHHLNHKTTLAIVEKTLRNLPERQREMIYLSRECKLPQKAIAKVVGIRPATVNEYICKGMAHIRNSFSH